MRQRLIGTYIEAAVLDRDGNLVVTTGVGADFTTAAMRCTVVQVLAGERVGASRTADAGMVRAKYTSP